MSDTDVLISRLASEARPIGRSRALSRLVLSLICAALAVLASVAFWIGDPLLGARTLDVMTVGVKSGFTLALVLLSGHMLYRSGRPNHDPRASLPWVAVPFAALAAIALIAFAGASPDARPALLFGNSWSDCLISVTALSLPVFAAVVLAFRAFAPTDLKLTGSLAGLTSGSLAAFVFALHCPEGSPLFVLVWYGLAILATTALGRLAGPKLLRW